MELSLAYSSSHAKSPMPPQLSNFSCAPLPVLETEGSFLLKSSKEMVLQNIRTYYSVQVKFWHVVGSLPRFYKIFEILPPWGTVSAKRTIIKTLTVDLRVLQNIFRFFLFLKVCLAIYFFSDHQIRVKRAKTDIKKNWSIKKLKCIVMYFMSQNTFKINFI